jgi:hypothetical protein
MKTTVKGYDGDDENNVDLSVTTVEGEIVGTIRAGDGEATSWLTPEQLRDLAREALSLADRLVAANQALKGGAT